MDIDKLIYNMTLDEKIGQLQQLTPDFYLNQNRSQITGPLQNLGINEEDIWNSGSVLGIGNADDMIAIQKEYLQHNRHKIPLLFMLDVIHGYRTIFPVPIALGCSWDLESAFITADISAKEASVSGVNVTFSPMVDLVRDSRWGRVVESTGEDTYLNSLFARAFVKGYQNNFKNDYNIAACVKHFAAYGAVEAGREYNTVDISKRTLKEYYLPPYKAAIDEGVEMVMTSFNTVLGIPSTANSYLLNDILRKEFGYDKIIISDWGAVGELVQHGVAKDDKEAALKAINSSVDIEMMTPCYIKNLKTLVHQNKIDENLINKSVKRILTLKQKLGLFDNPFKIANSQKSQQICLCDEHRKKARDIATKSIVLLKNDNILPLDKTKKIAIIGPFAQSSDILGPWSLNGKTEDAITLEQGIVNKIGNNIFVSCTTEYNQTYFEDALNIAKKADTILLALGENSYMSGEAGSRAFITLPKIQQELAKLILNLNKPTVLILFSGRPLEITELNNISPAILQVWFPGTEGGNAIADILFGDVNPSARLSISIPYTVGQLPIYYNCYNTGRPKTNTNSDQRFVSKYIDIPNEPLYPFGYGLSYTEFEYSDFSIDKKIIKRTEKLNVSLKVRNIGKMDGIETVQLYIRDLTGNTVRPIKELKGFKRIYLKPNEQKLINFEVNEDMLKYYNFDCDYIAETGEFEIMVGRNSADLNILKFELVD